MMNAGSHFGEAKKSKCPAGMKRMVKATPKANHNALTLFQAAFAMLKGSLKRLGYGNRKSGYGGNTPCAVARCAKGWGSLKMFFR